MKDNFRPSAAQPNPPNETRVKETDDMTFLIEQHKRDIWEWKQRESEWIRDKNQLEGNKRIINDMSEQIVALRKKVREAEGEVSIVKGIGINSPEMRSMKAEVESVKERLQSCLDINDEHQRYNGKLQTRLTEVEEEPRPVVRGPLNLFTCSMVHGSLSLQLPA
jgi:hypothetical protein